MDEKQLAATLGSMLLEMLRTEVRETVSGSVTQVWHCCQGPNFRWRGSTSDVTSGSTSVECDGVRGSINLR